MHLVKHSFHLMEKLGLIHKYLPVPTWFGPALRFHPGPLQSFFVLLLLGFESFFPCVFQLNISEEVVLLPPLVVSGDIQLQFAQIYAPLLVVDLVKRCKENFFRINRLRFLHLVAWRIESS